jgi:outer membrane biosynthesis protein TonB
MPKSKSSASSKAEKPTKASFVRAIPSSVPAKEVVAKAKAAGMTLSEKHVYVIRSDAKKRSKKKAAKGSAPKASSSGQSSVAAKTVTSNTSGGAAETSFRKLVLALGIPKSRALVSDVERRLNQLISGK